MKQYLGIEIGGTKLQLGVRAAAQVDFVELVRDQVDAKDGATGILTKIRRHATTLCSQHHVSGIGVGFGGPVSVSSGMTTKSHQIEGWELVPLCQLLQDWLSIPATLDNDCNVAALAEARWGAGQGAARVFYVTVGTGIGGGLVIDGHLQGSDRPAIAEIGHLRPGLSAIDTADTVESLASGWSIANWARRQLLADTGSSTDRDDLLQLCEGDVNTLTTELLGQAASRGNDLAVQAIHRSTQALGWAVAQVVTLLAPQVIVVGGGVSLSGDLFFANLREQAARYVFPPLAASYEILPAKLGESVVVHGAIEIAAAAARQRQ